MIRALGSMASAQPPCSGSESEPDQPLNAVGHRMGNIKHPTPERIPGIFVTGSIMLELSDNNASPDLSPLRTAHCSQLNPEQSSIWVFTAAGRNGSPPPERQSAATLPSASSGLHASSIPWSGCLIFLTIDSLDELPLTAYSSATKLPADPHVPPISSAMHLHGSTQEFPFTSPIVYVKMGSRTESREDRSGTIEIVTYALTGTFVVFFIARQIMKAIVFRKMALDDLFILLATTFAIGLSVTTLILTSKGFGVYGFLSVDRADSIMKGYYASELLYISSLCFSKLSILVLFYNVVVLRTHRFFVFGFGACIFAWSVASVAAAAFQCNLPRPWEMMTLRCFNTRVFWIAFCAVDMSTELFIVMLSIDLVAHLRVRMSRKLAVVACFAPRLLVASAALVRAVYMYQVTPHDDPEYDLWITTICTQVHSLQSNMWRSYSTRSWAARSRASRTTGQVPNRLRKREANIRFESPKSFSSLIREPERVSIVSPRIPSPTPISPFMPPPIAALQLSPNPSNAIEPSQFRGTSTAETLYDSDSDEVFDIVSLHSAMCLAPSPIEPPTQARLSSTAIVDISSPLGYLALLGSPDPSSSSSCYSSRASTPTRTDSNPRFSLFPQDVRQHVRMSALQQMLASTPAQTASQTHPTAHDEARLLARQTLPNPAISHDFDDFAHPARSPSSRSHPKFSTTPRLNSSPPTTIPSDTVHN
ncbi:hypothetical protein OPT61_g4697 [Boeremia exigua]|uniref:Uncharacterized protein n=1 Tax=Boeremia exigua TaxID=749465 RepID=A0ACC2ID02_9PLEO|nr:hypothetical protein OPT61_g4697 [Boeremia exigua]